MMSALSKLEVYIIAQQVQAVNKRKNKKIDFFVDLALIFY